MLAASVSVALGTASIPSPVKAKSKEMAFYSFYASRSASDCQSKEMRVFGFDEDSTALFVDTNGPKVFPLHFRFYSCSCELLAHFFTMTCLNADAMPVDAFIAFVFFVTVSMAMGIDFLLFSSACQGALSLSLNTISLTQFVICLFIT